MISSEARKDIRWWLKFMPKYNGISILWMEHHPQPDEILASDACMNAARGQKGKEIYAIKFPKEVKKGAQIAHLEIWGIIVTLKIWEKN